ncbi:MAG: HlyD family secretion protein [Gammaproteobacteria bacterium]
MNRALFRQEAIDAQRNSLRGAVLLARQPTWLLFTIAAVLMVAATLSFAIWGQFTRKEHVTGYLAPTKGLIKIFTPQPGRVLERHVMEGQAVTEGEVLLIVSSERATTTTREAQAAMLNELRGRRESLQREQTMQSRIDQLATAELAERMRGLETEITQVRAQIELQRSRVASAEHTVKRHEALGAARFVSEATVQQKQDELLDARNQLAATQRNLTALARDLNTARLDLAASELKRANNGAVIERQISELEQQLTETDTQRVVALTAPADGTVTTILAGVGQAANPGAPLLSILPAGAELEAHLLVPTRAAGFIKPRQEVALRYQAFPYQRFGHYLGEVMAIGRTVIQPNESNLPLPVQEPVYLVTVRLPVQQVRAYGQDLPLQAGMALDADVHVDRRRLIEWVFDPILSVSGRI